ncbi:hypothetical protein DEAC_c44450 [Desulfosporosinus acididurans]|uniref:Urease accessory protein UreH-like transmembrane domain-containing protein n=1 Tax=Desulfosporosinus acididurans TaxID=476652 RepID=A0A0J1FJK8_9FIRM|nr:hypothetical protein [Desulfosporosinus acididurans]KLU63654.1 hypothetical protein DEAC_c44450 [Desulfosporosinus acididurans]
MLNLWNPSHLSLSVGLITAFILGMIHGITPDEHTWPITFSYSIGSYSSKKGMLSGLVFSTGFTLQRAIASELAFMALTGFLMSSSSENIVYIIVGIVMAISGYYILHKGRSFHLIPWLEKLLPQTDDSKPVPIRLAFLHGIIAGCGTGAFATIIYTVISPTMPSVWVGFVPGLLFGLGTLSMQVIIGALFGWWIQSRNISQSSKANIGQFVSGNTLQYGGLLFMLAGILGLIDPSISDWGVNTGIRVHNLDSINIGVILVVIIVAGIGGVSMWLALRKNKENTLGTHNG